MAPIPSAFTIPAAFPLQVTLAGQGFPILCLHGHPGSGRSMSVFTEHLSRRYRTLTPDLRGYGRSQTTQDFAMADHLEDLEALLNRQGIDRCLVLGWSLGGILAMELALRLPERITGLILVATAAYPRGSHPPITWQDNLLTGMAALVNWAIPGWDWTIETLGKRSLFRYLIQQHTPNAYRYLAREAVYAYQKTSPQATRALMTALRQHYNRLEAIAQIHCPCLVMAGECDRHITAASSQQTADQLPQGEWHCYANTAHLFPWEIPNQLLHDIDVWLEKHPDVVPSRL